ncbi:hypothetical protein [Paraburkholderia xenovorans]|uniref:hypothetical protein n=1 Tax=Paraburkholderia xenovorans TaxID=36873 RepID=UPI003898F856
MNSGSIADQLRGQKFRDFDHFRSGFWKAVPKDTDLISQFSKLNVSRMSDGLAPKSFSDARCRKKHVLRFASYRANSAWRSSL